MTSLAGRTLLVTGASRGIGLAIALRAARDGANVAVLGKTESPHPKLPGTIHEAARAIEAAGGRALPVACDVRDEAAVARAVEATLARFGALHALVNNASAISLTGTLETPVKRFDLMLDVNLRGTFVASRACLPALLATAASGADAHILTLAPPPLTDPKWYRPHVAYSLAKGGMSLVVLGLAAEFEGRGVSINALWPRTVIATSAVAMIPGAAAQTDRMRKPEIVADAAHVILTRPSREASGRFHIDEDVLREAGVTDFDDYAVKPGTPLLDDLFLEPAAVTAAPGPRRR